MFKVGNVKVGYLITAAWAVLSLLLAHLIAGEKWGPDNFTAKVWIWLGLMSGPLMPFLWVSTDLKTPAGRQFVMWIVGLGGLGAIVALRYEFTYTAIGLFGWMMMAFMCALHWPKGDDYIIQLELEKLVKALENTEHLEKIVIEYEKYLHLLSAQAAVGFPSVMRLRAHFLEALPEVIPSLKDDGGLNSPHQTTREMARMRQFMLEKLTYQLAYLCAISFFDRVCGPDFRGKKQYQALVKMLLQIKSTEQEVKGVIKRRGQKLTVMTIDDLREVEHVLGQVRNDDAKEHGRQVLDSDLTITWAARTILVHRQFLPEKLDSDTQAKMFEMMRTGMREVGQTFLRMSSEYAVRR
jgi:hypothetical protein